MKHVMQKKRRGSIQIPAPQMRNNKEVILKPDQLFQGSLFPMFIPKTTSVKVEPTEINAQYGW